MIDGRSGGAGASERGAARRARRTLHNRNLRLDLRRSTIDGCFFTLMVGIAEVYLAAFVLRVGLGPVAAGLIVTVPLLTGAVIQSFLPPLLRRVGSYRRWVGLTAMIQALLYLPLAGVAIAAPWFVPELEERGLLWILGVLVFGLATLYFAAGIATGPAWQTMSGFLFHPRIRARYFARRSALLNWFMIGGILATGLLTAAAREFNPPEDGIAPDRLDPFLIAFAIAFTIGCFGRLVSARFLASHTETPTPPGAERRIPWRDYVSRFRSGEDGKFLLAILVVNFTTQIAQPFYNPFMLEILRLNRPLLAEAPWLGTAFSWFLVAAIVGRILVLPLAGRLAHTAGPGRVMLLGGACLAPVPLLWLVTDNMLFLLATQMVTGMAWALWDLGSFLMVYEKIRPEERTGILTYQMVANELTKTSGSLVGGGMLDGLGKDAAAYGAVFTASTIARLGCLVLLLRIRLDPLDPAEIRTDVVNPGPIGPSPAGGGAPTVEPALSDPPGPPQAR